MPTYVCVVKAGLLNHEQKQRIETAIYFLNGRVDTHYGVKLKNSVICEAGDFVYIKADVPHQPINLSATDRQWLSSHAMTPMNKKMLSPIEYKIANETSR